MNNSQLTDFNSIDDMASAHRKMLKSLLDQDGTYNLNQAMEINNAFGKQVNLFKVKLEAFTMMKHTPSGDDLFLPAAHIQNE